MPSLFSILPALSGWSGELQKPDNNHVVTRMKMTASPVGVTEKRHRTKVSGGILSTYTSATASPWISAYLRKRNVCLFKELLDFLFLGAKYLPREYSLSGQCQTRTPCPQFFFPTDMLWESKRGFLNLITVGIWGLIILRWGAVPCTAGRFTASLASTQ